MKLFGKKIDKPSNEFIVIPRDGQDYIFTAQAVLDFKEFDKLVKEPVQPVSQNVRTGSVKKVSNKSYTDKLEDYSTKRMNFIILKSLEATDGLTWDKVDMKDPSTWDTYESELQGSGLSTAEINKIVGIVLTANSLDDSKYEEARKRFLASQSKKA